MTLNPRKPMPVTLGVDPGPERTYRCPECAKVFEAWRFVVMERGNGNGVRCPECFGPLGTTYPKKTAEKCR